MDFTQIRGKSTRYAVGLTAGMSCAGIDGALVRLKGHGPDLLLKYIKHQHFPFTPSLNTRLLGMRKEARELCLLNFELGERLAEAALDMLVIAKEEDCEVDFVASNGFTISHHPPRGPESATGVLQLGESAVIAERTELPVVSDLCARDMAAGGQGALIRPYSDWLLFRRENHTVACLHLGGVAHVSIVTPRLDEVTGFDIGPCNITIDGAVRLLSHGSQLYDKAGEISGKGVVIDEFLDYLLDHPYFMRVPPKSTGRDEFGPEVYLRDALSGRRQHSMEDIVATVTAAVAYSITRAFSRFISPQYSVSRVIVSGGGARNKTLMQQLKNGLRDVIIRPSDRYGIPHEALDAVGVAMLGNEALCGSPANVPTATGARRPVILGKITPA